MKRLTAFKRVLACAAAVVISMTALAGAGSDVIRADKASADSAEMKQNKDNISDTQTRLTELEQRQAELDEKINSTKDDITAEEENQAAIEEQINTVQQTIMTLDESITELEGKIAELEDSIAQKEIQIGEKRVEIESGVSDFKTRIRSMYVAGSSSYSDIIIGASDFYDMLMKIELVKRVAEHDDEMIDNLILLKQQYEADEVELNNEKAELEQNKLDLQTQEEAHQKQKEKLEELFAQSKANLERLNTDAAVYQQNKEVITQEQEEFEEQLQQLYKEQQEIKQKEEEERKRKEEEERKRKEEEERKRKEEEERKRQEEEERKRQEEAERQRQLEEQQKLAEQNATSSDADTGTTTSDSSTSDSSSDTSSSSSSSSSSDSGQSSSSGSSSSLGSNGTDNSAYGYTEKTQFTWPVPGFYHISYGVGWRWGAYHKGIDIWSNGIRGANICAAAAGEVIFVNNVCPHDYGKTYSCGCGGGYGKYCIIDHGNGYWTLYGHSQNIIVSVGDHVEQGQVLGYVGSTGHSTGDHLHFEVRLDGVAQDPTNYV